MEKEIKAIENADLQQALLLCTDNGYYPDVFDLNIGKDFKLETRPELSAYIKQPRTAKIIIASFIGYCGGAQHYYARIEADGIDIVEYRYGIDGNKQTISHGGYICEEYKNMPRNQRDIYIFKYTIEIDTRVTELMKESDPQTWDDYDVGDKTNRFSDKQDAINTAIMVASARFPGWRIILKDEIY